MNLQSPLFIFLLTLIFLLWSCDGGGTKPTHQNQTLIKENATKRQYNTNEAANKRAKAVVSTFRETVIRVMLYNGLPKAHLLGIASSFILNLIVRPPGGGLSVWDKVSEKVRSMVRDHINDNNIANLEDDWNYIGNILQTSPRSLTAAKIRRTLAKLPNFFPNTYPSSRYSLQWPQTMMKYLSSLKAMYIDLSQKEYHGGGIEGCEWVKLWKRLRPEVIKAGKILARARWEKLEGINWHGGTMFFKPTGKYSYRDGATGTRYNEIPVNEVKGRVLSRIKDKIAQYLFEHIGKRFNALNDIVQEPPRKYTLKKESARCRGTNDEEAWVGKVKSAEVCAVKCFGVSNYFSFAKPNKLRNRKCSAATGLHECDCYCEDAKDCTTTNDKNFDVFEFSKDRGMYDYGPGPCKEGYYADQVGKGIENAEACKQLCMDETKCTFATYMNSTAENIHSCRRYKAAKCSTQNEKEKQNFTYKKVECFLKDQDYYGKDIECKNASSATECQTLCQQTANCAKFSYITNKYNGKFGPTIRGKCCLKNNGFRSLIKEIGVISGPKLCGVTECDVGPALTVQDFMFDLPQACYGKCAEKNRFWPYTSEPCDLPCLNYDGNPPECLIRGGYTDPDYVFNRDGNIYDCERCYKADWLDCMPVKKPKAMFPVN